MAKKAKYTNGAYYNGTTELRTKMAHLNIKCDLQRNVDKNYISEYHSSSLMHVASTKLFSVIASVMILYATLYIRFWGQPPTYF